VFAPSLRKMIYTINAVEALHRSLREFIKVRGTYPTTMPGSNCVIRRSRMPAFAGGRRSNEPAPWASSPCGSANAIQEWRDNKNDITAAPMIP
jgi:hypothetical protein